ncbi:unnamed protein product [Moneuplotes crassus]|uniref:ABC transporter domain-containing protein n=1 Tax=Euplotes crassus TaxID=5936 RepID=A0AAD1XIF0_EUPCR|nr:unnamed protein product [Moneuplotes crassus]
MKIMGLMDTPYWLSWLTYYLVINTFLSLIMMLILIPVFEYSNKFLVFLYLWIYGMTMFSFGLLIGAFFSTGKTASIVSSMLFFLSSFLVTAVQDQTVFKLCRIFLRSSQPWLHNLEESTCLPLKSLCISKHKEREGRKNKQNSGKGEILVDKHHIDQTNFKIFLKTSEERKTITSSSKFKTTRRRTASIYGYDIETEMNEIRKMMEYCPQHNILFPKLTVKEHFQIFTKFKGRSQKEIDEEIDVLIKDFNLDSKRKVLSKDFSGGNKRKLSVAMAMIWNPPVVFLDEPSAGMDPKARRFMWEVIAKISTRGKNSAVILTAHSMEEAEALSTTMGIMVDGQFKCFGSKQHIKNKFGTGYQVEINPCYKVENIKGAEYIMLNKDACSAVLRDLLGSNAAYNEFHSNGFVDEFGEATLIEQYSPRFRYRVPKGEKSVGYFFSLMEKLKSKLDIDEYSAS